MDTLAKLYFSNLKKVFIFQLIAIVVAFLVSLYFAVKTVSVCAIIFAVIFGLQLIVSVVAYKLMAKDVLDFIDS